MDDAMLPTQTLYTAPEGNGSEQPERPSGDGCERSLHASGEPTADSPDKQAPFLIELRRVNDREGGHFRPEAILILTPFLRTSGLLRTLPAEDLASLLYMLTFLTPNGDILPTVPELALAMGIAAAAVRYRMERLMRGSWQGKPLVLLLKRDSGLHAYALSPALVAVRLAREGSPASDPVIHVGSRAAVIAHSRAAHTKPRQYVEEMIARLNNWDRPGPTHDERGNPLPPDETRILHTRLTLAGVAQEQANMLLVHYPLDRIREQLDWLPLRYAKSPARFLVAAIEKNFSPPRGIDLPPISPSDSMDVLQPQDDAVQAPENGSEPEDTSDRSHAAS